MTVKTLLFDFSITRYVIRYKQTYKTWHQVEIWLLLLTAFKVSFALPNYFLKEMNYLFYIFVLHLCS